MAFDKLEASAVLQQELTPYRTEPYAVLVERVGSGPIVVERRGASGTTYQIEIEIFWDDKPNGPVRVMGGIDDGGWRAFSPLCQSFAKSPDNSFVGE